MSKSLVNCLEKFPLIHLMENEFDSNFFKDSLQDGNEICT